MRGPVSPTRSPEPTKGSDPISLYQRFISPVDGDRCQMLPGCSAYAAQAIEERGFILGYMLAADRIIRCGYDLDKYEPSWRGTMKFYLDPPPSKEIR
ncbi:MAG TPA: membrane protein insertion efficiency factor YidD [Candidatus Cloacimonadota bacterium]|nr:membrane protein insertion efficiency factor YidD [Candidatus Cloacimonadota bacterium]